MTSSTRLSLAVGILAALLGGCKQAQPKAAALPPVSVTVAKAKVENVPTNLQAIGAVQAVATVTVKTLVGGQLQEVEFHQGDEVHKGQVLFKIDPSPFEAALAQAEANLARDLATDSHNKTEAGRYADLAKQGIVSAEQNDQMQSAASASHSVVSADRAAVEQAKLQLSYCTIISPIDGRTGSLLVQAGNTVQPNQTVLVTINQIKPIYVAFSVPEQYLQQLKQLNGAHPLEVHALAQGDAGDETGHLSFINNAIDTTTGTIQLMATFENRAERLWPGEYVNTKVTLGIETGAVVVPSSAVQTGQDNQFVYVVTPQSTVENHTVKTSTTVNGITVITEGVAAGDTVVVDGQLALFPGAKVAIKPPVGVGGTNGAIEAEK